MHRKYVPLFIMLVAGAITTIMTYRAGYGLAEKLLAVFLTLLIFYGLGSLLKGLLDSFYKQNEEKEQKEREEREKREKEEGEAAEKEAASGQTVQDVKSKQTSEATSSSDNS